jgi:hypothetical protein
MLSLVVYDDLSKQKYIKSGLFSFACIPCIFNIIYVGLIFASFIVFVYVRSLSGATMRLNWKLL